MNINDTKDVLIAFFHQIHDDLLNSMMAMEKILTLFGEDMSWYEEWRDRHSKENQSGKNL
jgi:hypothetical protein